MILKRKLPKGFKVLEAREGDFLRIWQSLISLDILNKVSNENVSNISYGICMLNVKKDQMSIITDCNKHLYFMRKKLKWHENENNDEDENE